MINKISFGQYASMLLASDAFALICYSNKMSLTTLICFITAVAIQFLISLFFIKKDIPINNKFMLLIYFVSAVLWGALLFIRVWDIAKAIYIPLPEIPFISSNLIISALIAIVCLYASSPGIKAVSRASVIIAGFGILCIIVIIFGSFKSLEKENLFIKNNSNVFSQITTGLAISGSFCILPYLMSRLKSSKTKTTIFYFIFKTAFYTIAILLTLMVTGGIMEITEFPVIRAAELCQPFNSQRIDALFIIVLVLLAVMGISVQTVTSSQIIETIFPKFRRYKSTSIIILMIILATILGNTNVYGITYAIIFLIPSVFTAITSLLGLSRCSEKGKK